MATKRQRQANHENSLKSTGPTSGEGKITSSKNALTHGLRAEHFVYLDEDTGEFSELRAAVFHHFQPKDFWQKYLVERVAVCMWRLRRVLRLETGVIADAADTVTRRIKHYRKQKAVEKQQERAIKQALGKEAVDSTEEEPFPFIGSVRAIMELASDRKLPVLALLGRYEASAKRELYRLLPQLEEMRAKSNKSSSP